MTICAILAGNEGAASPLCFLTEILLPHVHDRLVPFIAEHAANEEIEEDSYKTIPKHLALPTQEILVPAKAVGLATMRIAPEVAASGARPSLQTSSPSVLG